MNAHARFGVRRDIVVGVPLALSLTFSCVLASPALAAWPTDPAAGLPICPAAVSPANLALASDGAGGAYFVWRDSRAGNWDLYAQHIRSDGARHPGWPAEGVAVCALAASLAAPEIIADGLGGAVVFWSDLRGANGDIYAHHLLADGLDPAWTANGVPVCTAALAQSVPAAVADGSGGAIIAWQDQRNGNTDLYAQRVLASGGVDPAWPANGLALCVDPASQSPFVLTSDGAGGVIVAWSDLRSVTSNDLYATRVLAGGALDPFWPADGRLVAGGTGNQYVHSIAPDGSGGVLVAWLDTRAGNDDIYAHRISRSGELHPAWPANGLAVASRTAPEYDARLACDASGNAIVVFRAADMVQGGYDLFAAHVLSSGTLDYFGPWHSLVYGNGCVDVRTETGQAGSCLVVADGRGNALIAWHDDRSGTYDPYAQWLGANGAFAPRWSEDGLAICTTAGNQYSPRMIADGTGGLIASWEDQNVGTAGLYCRRVTRFATFGSPEPVIHDVADVANDQGGRVHVLWKPALGDGAGLETIERYTVWRQPSPETWEFLAEVPARAAPGYALMAPTNGDSTYAGVPWAVFRVLAHDSSYSATLASLPDSGYSRDDLVPGVPAGFSATREGALTKLRWNEMPEADLDRYRLYRGSSPDFAPDPSHLIAEPTGTSFDDAALPPCWYRLSAVDVHGNEGPTELRGVRASAGAASGETWPYHPRLNLPVTLEGGGQYEPSIVTDDAGGAFVFYVHEPAGSSDFEIRAQHVMASGGLDEGWPPAGAPVCTATNLQASPVAVARAGGALVAWEDERAGNGDIYSVRLLATGLPAAGWTTNGVALCTASGSQSFPQVVASVSDGAIVLWRDGRGDHDAVYAQRVLGSGTAAWAANGVAVAASAGAHQMLQHAIGDGAGGAYVAWRDDGTGAVLVHHLLVGGTLDAAWPAGGRQLSASANFTQLVPGSGGFMVITFDGGTTLTVRRLTSSGALDPAWPPGGVPIVLASFAAARGAPDGSNGALIAWIESHDSPMHERIAALRITSAGTPSGGWPSGGVTIIEGPNFPDVPFVLGSADGGALLAWFENRIDLSTYDVYAQRVLGTGVVDPDWPAGGRAACLAAGSQWLYGACADAAGGLIAAWADGRGALPRVYVQRVEATGVLGHPEPVVTSVHDVAADQGGRVRVEWQASPGEHPPFHGITEYTLWRRLTLDGLAAARARGAPAFAADAASRPRPGTLRQLAGAAGSTWWEYVASVPVAGLESYAFSAPTTADSLPGEVFWNVFFVDAQDTSFAMNLYYPSAPDSGYSADNLAPRLPTPCVGFYADGATSLHWQVSTEPDFAAYRIYRNTTFDFPGPAGLVATLSDTGYVDVAGHPFYYFINVVDAHGNPSPNGLIVPAGILGTPPGGPPATLRLGPAHPNPSPGAVTIPLTLPRAARVTLTVLDVAGRRVHVLVDGPMPAGVHELRWDGRHDGGAPGASGLYFVRLEIEERTLHTRVVRTR